MHFVPALRGRDFDLELWFSTLCGTGLDLVRGMIWSYSVEITGRETTNSHSDDRERLSFKLKLEATG